MHICPAEASWRPTCRPTSVVVATSRKRCSSGFLMLIQTTWAANCQLKTMAQAVPLYTYAHQPLELVHPMWHQVLHPKHPSLDSLSTTVAGQHYGPERVSFTASCCRYNDVAGLPSRSGQKSSSTGVNCRPWVPGQWGFWRILLRPLSARTATYFPTTILHMAGAMREFACLGTLDFFCMARLCSESNGLILVQDGLQSKRSSLLIGMSSSSICCVPNVPLLNPLCTADESKHRLGSSIEESTALL